MDKLNYQIADNFCEEALKESRIKSDENWLHEHKTLFESLSIKPEGLPSISNSNFDGQVYKNIQLFHKTYEQKLLELNILSIMTQEEALVYFFKKMDVYNIDRILDIQTCQDIDKHKYMVYLNEAFEEMQLRKNTHLIAHTGRCQECKPGHKSYCFMGNNDNSHIDLLLELDQITGRVVDIYECLKLLCDDGIKPEYSKKIRIHEYKLRK